MPFTQVSLTGTITLANTTPGNGAVVSATLSNPITDGSSLIAPETLSATCNSSGVFSLPVLANDDSTTVPTGTFYSIAITYGTQTLDSFKVVVPHADAPSVNLFTLANVSNPTPATPYVVSINGQNGIIVAESINTVAASGSGTVTLPATTSATISRVTLTGAATIQPPSPVAGTSFTLELIQDATGSRVPVLTAFDWGSAGVPTLSTAANKRDFITCWSTDGTTTCAAVAGLGF